MGAERILSLSGAATAASTPFSGRVRRMRGSQFMMSRAASPLSSPFSCRRPAPPPQAPLFKHHSPSRITLGPKFCFIHQAVAPVSSARLSPPVIASSSSSSSTLGAVALEEAMVLSQSPPPPPISITIARFLSWWVLLLTPLCFLLLSLASGSALAAAATPPDSIRASGIGLKIAAALRRSGWEDEVVVFTLATLPVLELRGAIPVGYWMQLNPVLLTILSILGNMVPVPFIVLYLKRFASFLSRKNVSAARFLDLLFERAKEKATPVEEFQWLGLMLFVMVPFPGTGAWTGAIVASVLDMPFWSAVSANFFGVVLAGLLVNLLVNLGLKYAILTGLVLFFVSTFMWSVLRHLKKSLNSK